MELSDTIGSIKQIINGSADSTLLHNNANKASERIPVMRDMVAGEISKFLELNEMPEHVAKAHISGDIHFHDLDYTYFPMTNCCLIELEGMLRNGFKMGNAEIESPKSISTAVAVTAQIVAQVASHQYGGQSLNRFDEVMAEYVRKSYNKHHAFARRWLKGDEASASVMATEMTTKEVNDAIQALEYELNTLHTANGQTPFVTIGFGLGTSWEARLIQKAILDIRLQGLGKHKRTAVFPKLVFTLREGVNMKAGDVNYDIKQLAMRCTATRMYPDYLSYDKVVEVTGDFKAPMGCRSFLSGVPSGEVDGRNNLGVVSINLPRIGMLADGNMKDFWELLKATTDTTFDALNYRVSKLKGVKAKVAPILYCEGAFGLRLDPEEEVFPYFKDRSSVSLGYIGLHELALAMFKDIPTDLDGMPNINRPDINEFLESVLKYLRQRVDEKKYETGLGYALYATPSESLCDRFCRLDAAAFGVNSVTEKGYYTNSHHLDVNRQVSPTAKFDYEKPFTKIASGGCISYVELPNMKGKINTLEFVIDYAAQHIHYFGINTPVDYCGECDYAGESIATENGFECPCCGNHSETLQVTRRVCGYLGAPNARPFIEGKQNEVISRVKHGHG